MQGIRGRQGVLLADLNDIKVDWNYFPFMPTITSAAGGVMAIGMALCLIAFVVAAIFLVFAKASHNERMSEKVVSALIWVLVGAGILGAAVSLVAWASGALVW